MALCLNDIEPLFALKGDRMYAGEPVTQLEHALQSAQLAEQTGADAALIVAALLHDLGHMVNDQGDTPTLRGINDRHEYVALPFLRELFDDAVLQPIRMHVDAKRYLCARGHVSTEGSVNGAQYWANLSADSKRSLELQGGIFTDAEAQRFISQPHARGAVSVRLWDDAAKIESAETPRLSHYLAIAKTIALRR
ncbi:MAG TPA: HD domain-containing protein [Burkholderiaceae bacterium]|nr:HD domain-containing protein [Burkholderiaceae bacterium]